MRERYPDARVVTDVGGGLNFQRKGLVALLERLHRGDKLRIVVAHRGRLPGSGSTSSGGWPSRTAARSWFSATRITAPNRNLPRIFSPSCTPSVADCTDSAATETRSRRIRTLKLWFDAARWPGGIRSGGGGSRWRRRGWSATGRCCGGGCAASSPWDCGKSRRGDGDSCPVPIALLAHRSKQFGGVSSSVQVGQAKSLSPTARPASSMPRTWVDDGWKAVEVEPEPWSSRRTGTGPAAQRWCGRT